ncbi:MAG: hypothetical protein WBA89_21775 [Microcoleus sp.]|uniref:hypothetical protein n=1 Tax=Microcoleus sp. TaxID=44472 RepID=UPI003C725FCE
MIVEQNLNCPIAQPRPPIYRRPIASLKASQIKGAIANCGELLAVLNGVQASAIALSDFVQILRLGS